MKIKFLITGLMGLAMATSVFAQKGELSNAKEQFDKYETLRGSKTMAALANTSITEAKTSIDKAAANEKTAALPLTFAVKGAIYAALALRDTVPATSTPLFATADETLKKARDLDTKGESKKMIDDAYLKLAQIKLNKGIKDYGSRKYDAAFEDFDYFRTVLPADTNAILYTGLAASNANRYQDAVVNYNRLLATKYSKTVGIYSDLASLYLKLKDTTNALKTISEAVDKYPTNGDLSNKEINIYLMAGKKNEVIAKLEKAIANDPKNKALLLNAGILYSQTKDNTKASDMYKKALEIDPDYFEANLNMGYLIMNPGLDLFNAAQKLPVSKQKEYDADMAKASALFDQAKPYLLKAVQVNPKSIDALTNLRTYYQGKKDVANATATQKQIDALKQQGGN